MARKIIAGNWKMNLLLEEGNQLIRQLTNYCESIDLQNVEVFIAPTFIHLADARNISTEKKISIVAQNCSDHLSGAYTGEISVDMIKTIGAKAVLIGHSERREYFRESDQQLNKKISRVFKADLVPILCVGEKLEDRKLDRQEEIVKRQLNNALKSFTSDDLRNLVIAYEPVWAIGTGETANFKQAQQMHHFIRLHFSKTYHAALADEVSILYGGSVKPHNAKDIFSQPDVDGGLIGGSSLKYDDFTAIIQIGTEALQGKKSRQ